MHQQADLSLRHLQTLLEINAGTARNLCLSVPKDTWKAMLPLTGSASRPPQKSVCRYYGTALPVTLGSHHGRKPQAP